MPNSICSSADHPNRWLGVTAGFLGWALDGFDYFAVVFLVEALARQFSVDKAAIVLTLTVTLAMRPVGALVFGALSDLFGRRGALIGNVVFFTVVEVLCGFAPDYGVFLFLRALFGIGMGGEWGVGASLVMETVPVRWRGFFSGFLQCGYSVGYLLAAVAARFVLPAWGWRAMFWVGSVPALVVLAACARMPEPEAWRRHRASNSTAIVRTISHSWKVFGYLVVLMTLMMLVSHGSQDLYPDFLGTAHHLSPSAVSVTAILYNCGAILGSIAFGMISQRAGRRAGMTWAFALSLLVLPLWAFGGSAVELAIASFIMQIGVQGAWGIVPAHLIELAPASARSLLPGLAYQLGILLAAPTDIIEYALRGLIGYGWALAGFEAVALAASIVVINLGWERHGRDFAEADE